MMRIGFFLCLFIGSPTIAAAQEILRESFEGSIGEGWYLEAGSMEFDALHALEGEMSARFIGPFTIFKRMDISPFRGQKARISLSARWAGDANEVDLVLRAFDGCPIPVTQSAPDSEGWRRFSAEFLITASSSEMVVGASGTGGEVWIDGVRVELLPEEQNGPVDGPAAEFLRRALDVMESNALERASIDWHSLRSGTLTRARGATRPCEALEALRFAIAELGDGHSFLIDERWWQRNLRRTGSEAETFGVESALLQNRYGYIMLPGFQSGDPGSQQAFAREVQERLRDLDVGGARGWIVDLRQNGGGNMWPMLVGLGPLLGDGPLGYFINAQGDTTPWRYRDGAALLGGEVTVAIGDPYAMDRSRVPVALLVGQRTASSGEAIAISFQGRLGTRTFGSPTAGQTTGNTTVNIGEGWLLALTTTVMADREQRAYRGPLVPEEVTPQSLPTDDPDLAAAMEWLQSIPDGLEISLGSKVLSCSAATDWEVARDVDGAIHSESRERSRTREPRR